MTDPVSLWQSLCAEIINAPLAPTKDEVRENVQHLANKFFGSKKTEVDLKGLTIVAEALEGYGAEQLTTLAIAFQAAGMEETANRCLELLALDLSGSTDKDTKSSLQSRSESTPIPMEHQIESETELCNFILRNNRSWWGRGTDDVAVKRIVAKEVGNIFSKVGIKDAKITKVEVHKEVLEKYRGKNLANLALTFRRIDREDLAEKCDAIIEKRAQCQYVLCQTILDTKYDGLTLNEEQTHIEVEMQRLFDKVGMSDVRIDNLTIDNEILEGFHARDLSYLAAAFQRLENPTLAEKCSKIAHEGRLRCENRLCIAVLKGPKEEIPEQCKKIFGEIGETEVDINTVAIHAEVFHNYDGRDLAELARGFRRLGRQDLAEQCDKATPGPYILPQPARSKKEAPPADPFTSKYHEYDVDQQEIIEEHIMEQIGKLKEEEREIYQWAQLDRQEKPFKPGEVVVAFLDQDQVREIRKKKPDFKPQIYRYRCDEILHSRKALVKSRDLTPAQKESIKDYAATYFMCSKEELVFNKFDVSANGKTFSYQEILEEKKLLVPKDKLSEPQQKAIEAYISARGMSREAKWNMYNIVIAGKCHSYAEILRGIVF